MKNAIACVCLLAATTTCARALTSTKPASTEAATLSSSTPPPRVERLVSNCTLEPDPAGDLLQNFRAVVRTALPALDPNARDDRAGMIAITETALRVLVPRRALLRQHAAWALARLPRETLPDTSKWQRVPIAPFVQQLQTEPHAEPGFSVEAQRELLALPFLNPYTAVNRLRSIVAEEPRVRQACARADVLEGIARPRLVWANDDVDRPVLALVKRFDLFSVAFEREPATGGYFPTRIEWLKRPAPVQAAPSDDPSESALRAFTNEMEGYEALVQEPVPISQFTTQAIMFALDRVPLVLEPHARELYASARCDLLKLEEHSRPETSAWHAMDLAQNLPPGTTPEIVSNFVPLARWKPWLVFAFLSQFAADRSSVSALSRQSLLEVLAPGKIVRTNGDLESPELAMIDRDEMFAVRFRSNSEHTGYTLENVEWLRREAPPARDPAPH